MSARDVRLTIHVTADELERIDAAARTAGLSRTQYIVERAANSQLKFTVPDDLLDTLKKRRENKLAGAPMKTHDSGLRGERLGIHVSRYESNVIKRRAERDGLNITEYLLKKGVYTDEGIVPFDKELYIETIYELRAQARNINQINAALDRIEPMAWLSGVDGDLIDELVREMREDNVRTRAGITDAYHALQQAALASRLKRR